MVRAESVTSGMPMPPEQAADYVEGAVIPTLEALEQWEREGKVQGGMLAGRRGGVLLVEADSHDEVSELCAQLPVWGQAEWEILPLQTFSSRKAQDQAGIERVRAMAGS